MHQDQAASLRKAMGSVRAGAGRRAVTCLAIASGKGGVGKTFLAVNLAVAFQKLGRRVLLVDADLGLANADIVFGVEPKHTLQDALFQGFALEEVVVHTGCGVDLLAASSGTKDMVEMGAARMGQFVDELLRFADGYDVLLFDCAAGINSSVTAFVAAAPRTLVIATPEPTSLMDVYALMKVVHQDGLADEMGLVLNMVRSPEAGQAVADRLLQVVEAYLTLKVTYYGDIPYSENVPRQVRARTPLVLGNPDDPAARRVCDIAKRLVQRPESQSRLRDLDAAGLLDGMFQR